MAKTIGILSLKGGVGKTSTVVSLGAAMACFGKKVLLVDANFSAPNLGIHLNITPSEKTINDVIDSKTRVKDAIYAYDRMDVMPADLDSTKIKDPSKLKAKLSPIKRNYDVILIDSSPALNEETLAAMMASDELLVVTTPDVPSVTTTVRAVRMARKQGAPITGLVLNKVHNKKFETSIDLIESTVGLPVLAVIPYDVSVQEAQSKAIPSTIYKHNSLGTEEYRKLAATLLGKKYQPKFHIRHIFRRSPKKHEINRALFYDKIKKDLPEGLDPPIVEEKSK